jgi:hypothetical protein
VIPITQIILTWVISPMAVREKAHSGWTPRAVEIRNISPAEPEPALMQ